MALAIIWNKQALENIAKVIAWISQESVQQAEQVEEAILVKIAELVNHPERHPTDKFKTNNNGSYRAFETHNYRISYRYTSTSIRILRIRHVKQQPKQY